MCQNKSAKPNKVKKNSLGIFTKFDPIFLLFIVVAAWIFSQIILKDPRLISLFDKIGNIPDLLTLFPLFSSSLLIATWFLYRGKSVKSLNDIILFFSVSYALYLFLFDNKEFEKLNNLKDVVSNLFLFSAKIAILNCSIAKTIITLFEFIIERNKENVDRRVLLEEKQKTDDNKASSTTNKNGKEEKLEFNYKFEKSQGNKIEYEEVSILKYESILEKDSNLSVATPNTTNPNPPAELKATSSKKKLVVSLILISLTFFALPFLYSLFIHFHH
ncbi:hypothetical protein ACQV2E_15745 [Pantoea allii]|uniref:hypothetical protein n=1 Tax=Pantoea TaxID=53335 RepID=UPI003D315E3C